MQPQLALELADPGRRASTPSGSSGSSARPSATSGSMSRSRRSVSTAVSSRSWASASSSSARCGPLAHLVELALGRRPARGAARRAAAATARGRLGLAPAALAQLAELGLDDGERARRRARPGGRVAAERRVELDAAALGLGPLGGVGGEALLDLGQAAAAGTAGARRARRRAPRGRVRARRPAAAALVERGAGLGHGRGAARPRRLVGLEAGQQRLELGDPRPLAGDALGQLVERGCSGSASASASRAARPRRAASASAAALKRGVVLVELRGPARSRLGGPRPSADARRSATAAARMRQRAVGRRRRAVGPRRARRRWRPPRGRAERQPVAPKRSPSRGDDDGVGLASATSTASSSRRRRTTAPPSSASSRRSTPGRSARTCGADRLAAGDGARGTAVRRRRGRARRRVVSPARRASQRPRGRRRRRRPRRRRAPRRRRPRTRPPSPASILDQVEQGAEHAVDAGQALGAGPGAGLVERQRQRLGAGRPRVLLGVGGARGRPRPRRAARLGVGARAARPRSSVVDERPLGRLGGRAVVPRAARVPRLEPRSARSSSAASRASAQLDLGARLGRPRERRRSSPRTSARAGRRGAATPVGPVGCSNAALGSAAGLGLGQLVGLGPSAGGLGGSTSASSAREARRVGLEGGDHALVEKAPRSRSIAAAALGEHGGQATGPLAQRLEADQRVAEVVAAHGGRARPRRPCTSVSSAASVGLELALGRRELGRVRAPACRAGSAGRRARGRRGRRAAASSSATSVAVAAGGVGLALERAELAAHLAEQVLQAQ